MIAGSWRVSRGACCRCGVKGRPLFVLKCEPGKQPYMDDAEPGDPDASACADCWLEVADVLYVRFGVAV